MRISKSVSTSKKYFFVINFAYDISQQNVNSIELNSEPEEV